MKTKVREESAVKTLFCFRYCVEFEILKASKACRKETNYSALKEGKLLPGNRTQISF